MNTMRIRAWVPQQVTAVRPQAGRAYAGVNYVRFNLGSDAVLKARAQAREFTLHYYQDRVELVGRGGDKYAIYADENGHLLGADRQPVLSEANGQLILICRPRQKKQYVNIDFWHYALIRDPGVYRAATVVDDLAGLAGIIEADSIAEGEVFAVFGVESHRNGLHFSIHQETIPLASAAFRKFKKGQRIDLFLKRINGQLIIDVHNHATGRFVTQFEYNADMNRFTFYRIENGRVLGSYYVDMARADRSLDDFLPNSYLDDMLKEGTPIYVSYNGQQIPQLFYYDRGYRQRGRIKIPDDDGSVTHLFTNQIKGSVLKNIRGWFRLPVQAVAGGSYFVTFTAMTENDKTFIPKRVVEAAGLEVGDEIEAYAEYGSITRFRVNDSIVHLRTIRDRTCRIREAAALHFIHGLLYNQPSFLEHTSAQFFDGSLGVKVTGDFLRFFPYVAGSKHVRTRFFDQAAKYSLVALPDKRVVYWVENPQFDEGDYKIIEGRLLQVENPGEFRRKAARLRFNRRAVVLRRRATMALQEIARNPRLQKTREAQDLIIIALAEFPYQADLLSALQQIKVWLIFTEAYTIRKRQIHHELLERKKVDEAAAYLGQECFTPLEIAYGVSVIWEATSGVSPGHLPVLGGLWQDIHSLIADIPPEKLSIMMRMICLRRDTAPVAVLKHIVQHVPGEHAGMFDRVLAGNKELMAWLR